MTDTHPIQAAPGPGLRRRRLHLERPPQRFLTTDQAAAVLGLDAEALRARCRRMARCQDGQTVATLGAGIVALKLGTHWRFRLSEPPGNAPPEAA